MEIALVLGLLALAVALFALEWASVDVVTLAVLVLLVLFGVLSPEEAFHGLATEIVVMLGAIFVLSGALQRTGVLAAISEPLHGIATRGPKRLLLAIMALASSVSAFMNNTSITAIFVPPVMAVARRSGISASKLLVPLAYASMLGGTCTLIGTSTNVAVSGYIARAGMQPLGMFEIAPLGLVIVGVGIGYMMLVGRRLLPDHGSESLTEGYQIREYLSEIVVTQDSHMIGQAIFDSDLAQMGFRILEVIRGPRKFLPDPDTRIAAGDVMLVEGRLEELIRVKKAAGIEIQADVKLGDRDLETDDIRIVEVLVTPQSHLLGHTLKQANFRLRYGVTALAIYRHGQSLRDKIGRIPLRLGDVLLVQGIRRRLEVLRREPDFLVLGEHAPPVYRRTKGVLALTFFLGAIVVGTAGLLPLSVAFLSAAILTVLTRCIRIEEAHELIDWRLLILIGGMTAFGTAMDDAHSGTATFLAHGIVGTLAPVAAALPGDGGVMLVLAGFLVLTIVLTQPMSNAAAALVVLPVAVEAAQALGVNERTFAIGIMLAASASFIAPFEPSCILVYGPGRYKVMDFVRTGALLTLLLLGVILALLPILWPLQRGAELGDRPRAWSPAGGQPAEGPGEVTAVFDAFFAGTSVALSAPACLSPASPSKADGPTGSGPRTAPGATASCTALHAAIAARVWAPTSVSATPCARSRASAARPAGAASRDRASPRATTSSAPSCSPPLPRAWSPAAPTARSHARSAAHRRPSPALRPGSAATLCCSKPRRSRHSKA